MDKLCTRCNETKPVNEFSSNGSRLNSHCKKCRAQAYKKNYQNTEREQLRQRVKRVGNRVAAMKFVQDLKGSTPCKDCNRRYPYYVMQFDHLNPDDKIDNVSTMVSQGAPLWKLKNEIAKCEIVCANCHAIRTHSRSHHRTCDEIQEELNSTRAELDRLSGAVV